MGLGPGDAVEIFGLESEAGKKLNGQTGIVKRYIPEKGRYEVQLSPDRSAEVRPEHLRQCFDFKTGDEVEVFGLESQQGHELNGQRGVVTRCIEDSAPLRLEVSIGSRRLNLKASNLKKVQAESSESVLAFTCGDLVEVWGLTSDAGRPLNGQSATVTGRDEAKCRVEVRFDDLGGKVQSLKPQNLRKLGLMIGDLVEVVGLESESGQQLNGDKGTLKRYVESTGRWEVQFIPYKLRSLKAENLQRVDTAPFEGRA